MRFFTLGSSENPSILFIHGLSATAESCYGEVGRLMSRKWHVILCELDGHYPGSPVFTGIDNACRQIETWLTVQNLKEIHGLVGLSLGGTIAVSLLERGNIHPEKTVLDAAFIVDMGILKGFYAKMFPLGVARVRDGKYVPGFVIDMFMGKDNRSIVEMMYPAISEETCRNACRDVYSYHLSDSLRNTSFQVEFWRGSREPYPKKGAALLKTYIPSMKERVFRDMGHCQFLHEQPERYAQLLDEFMNL